MPNEAVSPEPNSPEPSPSVPQPTPVAQAGQWTPVPPAYVPPPAYPPAAPVAQMPQGQRYPSQQPNPPQGGPAFGPPRQAGYGPQQGFPPQQPPQFRPPQGYPGPQAPPSYPPQGMPPQRNLGPQGYPPPRTMPPNPAWPGQATQAGKSKLLLIVGGSVGAVALLGILVSAMSGGSSTGRSAGGTTAGGSPLVGQWTLVDTDEAAYCQSEQEFNADGSTAEVRAGVASTHGAKGIIYDVQPTFVLVSYGGPNYETWKIMGPDDLILQLASKYAVTSCRYHRK